MLSASRSTASFATSDPSRYTLDVMISLCSFFIDQPLSTNSVVIQSSSSGHPELLDWMTTEFVDNGWSMKKLHKLIMTSSVYREGSEVAKDAVDRDADNIYLSHFNRRRLSPEEIRDGMLQNSGVLNLKMGGRPVVPEVARQELYGLSGNSMWPVTANPEEHTRRSIYMLVRRTF